MDYRNLVFDEFPVSRLLIDRRWKVMPAFVMKCHWIHKSVFEQQMHLMGNYFVRGARDVERWNVDLVVVK